MAHEHTRYLVPHCEVRASYSCPQEGCSWQAIVGHTPRSKGTFRCPEHGYEPASDCEIMAGLNMEVRNTALQLEMERASRRECELVKRIDGLETSVRRQRVELGALHRDLDYTQQNLGRVQNEHERRSRAAESDVEQIATIELENVRTELENVRNEREGVRLELYGLQKLRLEECAEDVKRVRNRGEWLTALTTRTAALGAVVLCALLVAFGMASLVRLAFFGG